MTRHCLSFVLIRVYSWFLLRLPPLSDFGGASRVSAVSKSGIRSMSESPLTPEDYGGFEASDFADAEGGGEPADEQDRA